MLTGRQRLGPGPDAPSPENTGEGNLRYGRQPHPSCLWLAGYLSCTRVSFSPSQADCQQTRMNPTSSSDLAIIIPAYKEQFLAEALRSLSQQTNKDFSVYIGDDGSPQNLRPIVDAFSSDLRLNYHRFPNNMGAENLVRQWSRCVELAKNEKWVWLFSDDDIASPNCVEAFRGRSSNEGGDVYRFNTCVIDQQGKLKSGSLKSPDFESSEEMAYHLLYWQRGNSMPDHIFSRDVYERAGGFVYTPYAQGADWATSILFSKQQGMRVVQAGMISWRQSGMNISSTASHRRKEVMRGHYCFIEWVLTHFRYLNGEPRHGISFQMIQEAALYNLHAVIAQHYKGLSPSQYSEHLDFLRRVFGFSVARAMKELARLVLKTSVAAFKTESKAA